MTATVARARRTEHVLSVQAVVVNDRVLAVRRGIVVTNRLGAVMRVLQGWPAYMVAVYGVMV
jgi:hypothetical protein